MLEPFQLPFVQRGLLEVLILAVPAGLLGTWIVLRGLAFFSHAVGTAAFPGLVLADGLGFSAPLGAFAAAAAFSAGNSALGRRRADGRDSVVAIVLVACLASGVILASDVFGSGANVETLLFGSLLLVDGGDIALASCSAAATLLATILIGERWLASGFDGTAAGPEGRESALLDAALLGLIALATTAALTVVGALLVAALFVVPAITARLLTRRMLSWQIASVALVAVEGTVGLWLSVKTDAPPGATIACVSGAAFIAVAVARELARAGRAPVAVAAIALGLLVAGCDVAGNSDRGGNVEVVATTTEIADWARHLGGRFVSVDQVLAPNTDPHEYEPRPSDVEAVASADLVLANGDGLDEWIDEVVSDSGSDAEVVDLGGSVASPLPGGDAGQVDPHWWHDPRNAEAAVEEIARRLGPIVPLYLKRKLGLRTAAYLERLRRLDRGIARCMEAVPPQRRKLVTDHDAFGYFARRYGIDVVGAIIPSQTTEAQPSAKDIAELADVIEREDVTAVFPESSVSPKLAEAIAAQTGASSDHTLHGDSLGPEGSVAETYVGMEAANANAMVRGFTDGRRECHPLNR